MENEKRKTKTSTAVKTRYNNKMYTHIGFKLPKALVQSFKDKCTAEGISQAQIVRKAIEAYVGTSQSDE